MADDKRLRELADEWEREAEKWEGFVQSRPPRLSLYEQRVVAATQAEARLCRAHAAALRQLLATEPASDALREVQETSKALKQARTDAIPGRR